MQELFEHVAPLEEVIDYRFKDKDLLIRAMIHRSFVHESKIEVENNEKLELLGDSVLGLVVVDFLLKEYSNLLEGDIVKIKSIVVSEAMLTKVAKEINLGNFLYLSKGEELNKGRERTSTLSDAFEGLIGALYLDGGIDIAKSFLAKHLLPKVITLKNDKSMFDYKTIIQEYSQSKYKKVPVYKIVNVNGPDHNKKFLVDLLLNNKKVSSAFGSSKKEAEQNAAQQAHENLDLDTGNIFE